MNDQERDNALALPQDEFTQLISAPAPEQSPVGTFGLIGREDPSGASRADSGPADSRNTSSGSAEAGPATEREGAAIANALTRPRNRRRNRGIPLDWVALFLAFLVPPAGLLAGFVALIVGSRRNGWASPIAKAATSIAVVLSLALTGGLVVLSNLMRDEQAHEAIVDSSRAFCATLADKPGVLTSDTFGWPAAGTTVTDSLERMTAFEEFWVEVERVAPDGVRPEATTVVTAVRSIISALEASRIMNSEADRELMRAVAGDSRIPAWVAQYCE